MTFTTMSPRIRSCFCSAFVGALALGCSDDPVNLGEQALAVDRSELSSYAAEWDGYIEGFVPENSGSDRLRLSVDDDGNGTLVFGEDPAPGPLDGVEPLFELMFPPGIGAGLETIAYGFGGSPQYPIEGFEYAIEAAIVEDQRIRITSRATQPADAFCGLQPAVAAGRPGETTTGFSCGAQANLDLDQSCYPDLTLTEVSEIFQQPNPDLSLLGDTSGCKASAICLAYCTCTAEGCAATPRDPTRFTSLDITFDGALESDGFRLTGTLNVLAGTLLTARFERALSASE